MVVLERQRVQGGAGAQRVASEPTSEAGGGGPRGLFGTYGGRLAFLRVGEVWMEVAPGAT